MSRRTRYNDRLARLREAHRRRESGPNVGLTMNLAVLGALVVVALGVAAVFRGDEGAQSATGWMARFDASWVEWAGLIGLAALVIGFVIWRIRR